MAWYRGTGKENHKSLFEQPLKDRCIEFSEFEYNTGPCCKRCYVANAKTVKAI